MGVPYPYFVDEKAKAGDVQRAFQKVSMTPGLLPHRCKPRLLPWEETLPEGLG